MKRINRIGTLSLQKLVAETAFNQDKPMSQQLREERSQVESSAIRGRCKEHDAPVIAPGLETTKDERLGISPMTVKLPILTAMRIREYSEKHKISQREIFRQAIAKFFGDTA
jgi:hypothetical protein